MLRVSCFLTEQSIMTGIDGNSAENECFDAVRNIKNPIPWSRKDAFSSKYQNVTTR